MATEQKEGILQMDGRHDPECVCGACGEVRVAQRVAELEALVADMYPIVVVWADSYRRNYDCGENIHPTHQAILERAQAVCGDKFLPLPTSGGQQK